MSQQETTRRRFLKSAAGTAAALGSFHIVPRHVLGGPNQTPPSEIVNVALVGAGGRGRQNARDLMKLNDVRITAVADPAEHWDLSRFYYKGVAGRKPAVAEYKKHYSGKTGKKSENYSCTEYVDFREMLDKQNDLDAVLCATPDHMHATVSVASMRSGKHCYCEKPLTHNVAEARLVSKVAKETGLATQMGNQGHSNTGIRETVELIRAGAIGNVKEVHAWVPATRWNPGMTGRPKESMTTPNGLNWDLWLGPRKPVPFHSAYAPVSWRDFWDYGCGAMGDFGCHDLDSAVWALGLHSPSAVEMLPAGQSNNEIIPYGEIGYFDFKADDKQPDVRVTWYSGGIRPAKPPQLPADKSLPRRGVLFVGDKGVMVCGGAGGSATVFPESLAGKIDKPKPSIRRSNGHHRDWIDAIKGGPAASSNFEYGAVLTEITLLGVAALRLGKRIEWDSKNMAVTNMDGWEPMIRGDYRDGWKLS